MHEQYVKAAEQKNLEFKTEFNVNSLAVETDETLFLEILNNLVSNAIIYTNEGTVGIFAEEKLKNGKKTLRVKVYDTGIGIPEEKQKVVWEEFRQASEGTTRRYQGTGLGLSIVKKIIASCSGQIFISKAKKEREQPLPLNSRFSYLILLSHVGCIEKNYLG